MSEKAEQYRAALFVVIAAAEALSAIDDLPQLIQDIDRADAIGPLLNPTLWIGKNKAMGEDREMFEAALPLYRLGLKLRERRETQGGESEEIGR